MDNALDLIRDVRDDLNGFPKKLTTSFLLDYLLVDLPCGVVAVPRERTVGKSLVMTKVEVGFAPIVENVNLTMLVGTHRSRIDIDIGIELLHPDA